MAKPPRIVSEHKKEIQVIPPPPPHRIIHPENPSKKTFEIYFTKTSMEHVIAHCRAHADSRLEVMGFLIGDVYRWKNQNFTLVKNVVSTDLDSTNISVRFSRGGFEGLFEKLDDLCYDYIIVGWYHSHPGMGCFLSSKDLATQKRMFARPFHTALVVDPIRRETKAYKLKEEGYVQRKFAVYCAKKDQLMGGRDSLAFL